jgi:hypothetical protein
MSDFESLTAALEPWFEKSFSELPAELRRLVEQHFLVHWDNLGPAQRREVAMQVDYDHDPATKHERVFWWDVGIRYSELKVKEDELKVAPAIGTQAVAARNHEQRLINAERISLKEDEREVQSAAATEKPMTIERVRERWDKRDKHAAGLGLDPAKTTPKKSRRSDGKRIKLADALRELHHEGEDIVDPPPGSLDGLQRRATAKAGLKAKVGMETETRTFQRALKDARESISRG